MMGCSINSQQSGSTALFETKAEAEKAAKDFNCTGAHSMDDKWMPCENHASHEEAEKHESHDAHQQH